MTYQHTPFDVEVPPVSVIEKRGIFEATCEAYPLITGIGDSEDAAVDDLVSMLPDYLFDPTVH